jgi:hypothetical protein
LMGSLFALDLPAQKIQFSDVIETRPGRIGALAVLRTPHLARRSFRRASLPPKLSRLGCCPRARQYIRMMWYLDRLLPCAISFTLAAGAAHRPAHAAPTDPYRGPPPSHSTASAFAVLAQATQNSELARTARASQGGSCASAVRSARAFRRALSRVEIQPESARYLPQLQPQNAAQARGVSRAHSARTVDHSARRRQADTARRLLCAADI